MPTTTQEDRINAVLKKLDNVISYIKPAYAPQVDTLHLSKTANELAQTALTLSAIDTLNE